ncbi:MAG: FAD-dependent oxidoreductase, partial [Bacteroidales bacterium]|nr:FAD-dependent oxidoreductase [Bacteroidales bacterium]
MKIGIIGAGLSGLTCGWYLKKNSINDITIFESAEKAGGKLKTDRIDGFQLDRGFQVLLPAYPETKNVLDYDKLQLQRFHKGSLIYKNGKQIPFYDPGNGLTALFETVVNGPGSLIDKLILLKLKWALSRLSVEDIFNGKKTISSLEYLRELGFSERIIKDFWIPFYQGVFLENTLETDSRMLQFTFKMFAEAGAALPKDGMDAIPKQLVDYIGADKIRYNAKVLNYDSKSVTTSDGKQESFDKVVLACNMNKNVAYHSVTNNYYEAEKLPIDTKHVILNANPNRIINNVVMISNVAPNYSPNGKHLISVSANGIHTDTDVFLSDLKSMFGLEAANWKLVKSYTIREALPAINFEKKYEPTSPEGVFYCGDYLLQGSINGAMESGRRTAEEII